LNIFCFHNRPDIENGPVKAGGPALALIALIALGSLDFKLASMKALAGLHPDLTRDSARRLASVEVHSSFDFTEIHRFEIFDPLEAIDRCRRRAEILEVDALFCSGVTVKNLFPSSGRAGVEVQVAAEAGPTNSDLEAPFRAPGHSWREG
jgi:hypothetical protein